MVKSRAVISLGKNLDAAGEILAKLSDKYELVIFHKDSRESNQLGLLIKNSFAKLGKNRKVITMLTQVVVDKNDKAFRKPSQSIGPAYTEKEALKLAKTKGWLMKKDAGGYRRLVPSPIPIDIIEKREIASLITSGTVVVAADNNEPPVYRTKALRLLKKIDAAIDQDFIAEKLAELIHADLFISLTSVSHACLNYGTKEEIKLHEMTIKEAERYIKDGYFESGSMLPKIEACIKFAKKRKMSIICSADNLEDSLKGKSGTIIG